MLRALFPQAVFMPRQNAVHAPVLIQSKTFTANLEALIDSGATENFISPDVISYFSIPAQDLPNPRTIRNVDGTKNSIGEVTQVAYLQIHHQGKANTHPFFVIDLGGDPILLGMPFLAAYNPIINWTKGEFQGRITAYTCDFPSPRKHSTNDIHVRKTTVSTQLALDATKPKERPWQEMVPKEYHQFGIVFSNKAAQRFPVKRP
jgi:hypothetical protein